MVILWDLLLQAVADDCSCDLYTVTYLRRRLKNEGVRLLTVTLPKLEKSLLRSIELGLFDRPTDFAWKGRSLRYFRSLLDKIFDQKTGRLLPNFDVVAVYALRQLCGYCYKLGLAFDAEQVRDYAAKYMSSQKEIRETVVDFEWSESLRKNAETFYKPLYQASPDHIMGHGVRCGPGSFAGAGTRSTLGMPFWDWKNVPDFLSGTCNTKQRPHSGYFKPYPSCKSRIYMVKEKPCCEVLFVNKDSRGPRVISKEPLHTLRAQMAFFTWASQTLERVSRKTINFGDQSINRLLARAGSLNGTYATLDLKDASDRVSYRLCTRVFRHAPGIMWYLKHGRSTHYDLRIPKTDMRYTERLGALAGMGSGLTFPVMAFLAQLSICTAIQQNTGLRYKDIRNVVHVYGDDIVLPVGWVDYAKNGLEKSGLIVNVDKSYVNGPFRESCGGDYIRGNECSPIRLKLHNVPLLSAAECHHELRADITQSYQAALFVKAVVAHSHECKRSGLNALARLWIDAFRKGGYNCPLVGDNSPVLGELMWDSTRIMDQGVGGDASAPDGYLKKVTLAIPVENPSVLMCENKFLGRKIRPSELDVHQWLEGSRQESAFGFIIVPRRLKLRNKKVSVLAALAR